MGLEAGFPNFYDLFQGPSGLSVGIESEIKAEVVELSRNLPPITAEYGKCLAECAYDYIYGGIQTDVAINTLKKFAVLSAKAAKGVSQTLNYASKIGAIKCVVDCCVSE